MESLAPAEGKEGFATSEDGLRIHYLESCAFDPKLSPLLIVPGMMGIAEHHRRDLEAWAPRRAIAFSHRGIGKSGRVSAGQATFHHRASDISTVARHAGLERYFLYAFSRGVPMAVLHALENPERILGLILHDCDPVYAKPSEQWRDRIVAGGYAHLPKEMVRAYWQDAERIDLSDRLIELTMPTLFLRGEQPGSLLPSDRATALAGAMREAKVASLPNTAHELSESDRPLFVSIVSSWLAGTDPADGASPYHGKPSLP